MSSAFKEWLKTSQIKEQDSVMGDLARVIISDDEFPLEDDRDTICEYMESRLIVPDTEMVIKELNGLYTCYLKVTQPH